MEEGSGRSTWKGTLLETCWRCTLLKGGTLCWMRHASEGTAVQARDTPKGTGPVGDLCQRRDTPEGTEACGGTHRAAGTPLRGLGPVGDPRKSRNTPEGLQLMDNPCWSAESK